MIQKGGPSHVKYPKFDLENDQVDMCEPTISTNIGLIGNYREKIIITGPGGVFPEDFHQATGTITIFPQGRNCGPGFLEIIVVVGFA